MDIETLIKILRQDGWVPLGILSIYGLAYVARAYMDDWRAEREHRRRADDDAREHRQRMERAKCKAELALYTSGSHPTVPAGTGDLGSLGNIPTAKNPDPDSTS